MHCLLPSLVHSPDMKLIKSETNIIVKVVYYVSYCLVDSLEGLSVLLVGMALCSPIHLPGTLAPQVFN